MEQTTPILTQVKIVFFDLDDTLCAYWEASKKAMRDTFAANLLPGHTAQDMVRAWSEAFRDFSPTLKKTGWYASYLRKGESTRTEQMRLMLHRLGVEDDALAKKLGDTYAFERNANLELFPEALGVLETLKQRYPMGLITNGPADIQRQEIETVGVGRFFEHVYIEGEMGRGKPLPEVFEMIAAEVGKQPDEILFVGNSYAHDILPAITAGWRTAWIRRDTDIAPSNANEHPEDKPDGAPNPDATIYDLREVLTLLGI
ncbi:MAG TPA: HAD family hydrolase [Fimbriimonadaceae bacterium]|jgi:putative hydrolase of the HAD superfamily